RRSPASNQAGELDVPSTGDGRVAVAHARSRPGPKAHAASRRFALHIAIALGDVVADPEAGPIGQRLGALAGGEVEVADDPPPCSREERRRRSRVTGSEPPARWVVESSTRTDPRHGPIRRWGARMQGGKRARSPGDRGPAPAGGKRESRQAAGCEPTCCRLHHWA